MGKKTFILHDDTVNTKDFRMLTEGADLSVFESNPVMLLNHDDWDLPIGRWENVRKEGNKILADAVFDDKDEKALVVAGKVDRGFIKAASIGAWPVESSEDPALMLPGQKYPTITKWTVREGSVCTIGSNHNALALYDKENKRVDLDNKEVLIKLFDSGSNSNSLNIYKSMSKVTELLKLSDNANDGAIADEVRKIVSLNETLSKENGTLKTDKDALVLKLQSYETKEKEAREADSIKLVDDAIKLGLINAEGRTGWLEDFVRDFDSAKVRLSSIAPRGSISTQIKTDKGGSATDVKLQDKTFKEIVASDQIKELKKDPELYKQKFFEAYGKYPS